MRLIIVAVAAVFLASTASAAEFIVTKVADTADGLCDPSDCSLREAVIAANASSGEDAITLPAGVYVLSRSGVTEDLSDKGDLDVTDDLIVNGADAATTIIHGGGGGLVTPPDRIFDVPGNAKLTLNNVTLRDGSPPFAETGGAIRVQGTGDLSINTCVLTHNAVTGALSAGGAIYDDSLGAGTLPTLTVSQTEITNNAADDSAGGGILAADVNLFVSESTFSGNTASAGAGITQGLIASSGVATATIKDSTISDNTATGSGPSFGGGIIVSKSDLTVDNSTVSGNSADNGGGGVANLSSGSPTGSMTFTNATIRNNSANAGGGIFVSKGPLTITGGAIESNQATATFGGGISHVGDTITITGASIRDNVSEQEGGGIYVKPVSGSPAFSLEDVTIEGNSSNVGGGGAYAEGVSVSAHASVFRNNFGNAGGGLFLHGTTPATIQDSTFDGNSSVTFGGGLLSNAASDLAIQGSTLSGNFASLAGGGLFYLSVNNLTVENSTFSANEAGFTASALGNSGNATVTNATFFGNSVPAPGGAINNTGTLTLQNSALVSAVGLNCVSAVSSGGHNLDSDGSCGLAGTGDQNVDPQLGPLADNGGPTQTCAPLAGSPAIDAGDDALCPSVDQRGIARPLDGDDDGTAVCDIGAVEFSHCGDGAVQSPEECDDGNTVDGDDCNADCTLPSSGGTAGTGGTTGGTAGTSGGGTGTVEDASGGCSLIR